MSCIQDWGVKNPNILVMDGDPTDNNAKLFAQGDNGVPGGLVIAAIDNGMGLLGYNASTKYMVTAIVLVAAVTIDALTHRGRPAGT